ncbi:NUDIX domain-containing protein [Halolamina sp. C58]|uniref:NUDIX domain-containing protein n=1 Tax=Halolamina sp. C58 TaxID=3421640 RepID=UPI003EBE3869
MPENTDAKSWRDIRPVALAVVTRATDGGEELLVFELRDEAADETFYRPPGGGVEFGEAAADAAEREFEEELGVAATAGRRIAVLENRFTFEGETGHEYDFVYRVEPSEDVSDREELTGTETDGSEYRVTWKPLAAFRAAEPPPLYPEGLAAALSR